MRRLIACAAVLAAMVATPASARHWPGGARGVVALTYDDALPSQLDHVVPVLDAAGLKGTFFLSGVRGQDVARWKRVAGEGHELANHIYFHPCSAKTYPADPRYTSEAYTPDTMVREIAAQEVLLSALDGRAKHGFATPCGQTVAGGRDYLEPLRRSGPVLYARGVSESPAELATDPAKLDAMHIPARIFGTESTLDQMIAFADAARAGGGMAVFVFHGVGGDHLAVTADLHARFVAWLKAQKDIAVMPLRDALEWAKTHP